jgi:hypothetical protein
VRRSAGDIEDAAEFGVRDAVAGEVEEADLVSEAAQIFAEPLGGRGVIGEA